jgi:transposase
MPVKMLVTESTRADCTQASNQKEQRGYDKYINTLRHLVENADQHLKRWREIATHYARNTSSCAYTLYRPVG